uniref:Uncharacterized protein n=1 Tax=Meloidogyne javanica TaxID=6303 RepID=A0A915LXD2_MELJA
MGVARALTHMLTNTDEPRNSYVLLLNQTGMPLDVGKYEQVRINYPPKIAEATAKLTEPGRSTTFTLLIEPGTFPGLRINGSYEKVSTIRNYAGIIFTMNDGSANITEHYAGENLSENEGEESSNNDTDDDED